MLPGALVTGVVLVAVAAHAGAAGGASAPSTSSSLAADPPSRSDLDLALAAEEALERQRAFDAAGRQLEAIAAVSDPEQAASLRLRRCELLALQAEAASARRCARELAVAPLASEPRALAAWLAATLAADLGDASTARSELRSLVLRAPWTLGAARAVVAIRALAREQGGPRAERDALLDLAAALAERPTVPDIDPLAAAAERELHAGVWVDAGRAALAAGEPVRASAILADAAGAAAGTAWADDAAYWRAEALRASGRLAEALAALEALRDGRVEWPGGGASEGSFYDDALFEIGAVLAAMGRTRDAIAAWDDLGRRAPDSRLRDDADFESARLAFAGGDRARLDRFVHDHPDSRHVAEARRLLGAP